MQNQLADAVRHLLSALDKGYFDGRLTVCGQESAYVVALREQLAIYEASRAAPFTHKPLYIDDRRPA